MTARLIAALLLAASVSPALAQEPEGGSAAVAEGYTTPRVDFGIVVSDLEKSRAFYEKALGLRQVREFTVAGDFAKRIGLSNGEPLEVHAMQLGEGPNATAVKLLRVPGTRPSRPDNTYLHSTYGVRYLTLYVTDLDAALERAAGEKVKPIGEGTVDLPADIAEGLGIAVLRDPDGNFVELVGPRKADR